MVGGELHAQRWRPPASSRAAVSLAALMMRLAVHVPGTVPQHAPVDATRSATVHASGPEPAISLGPWTPRYLDLLLLTLHLW